MSTKIWRGCKIQSNRLGDLVQFLHESTLPKIAATYQDAKDILRREAEEKGESVDGKGFEFTLHERAVEQLGKIQDAGRYPLSPVPNLAAWVQVFPDGDELLCVFVGDAFPFVEEYPDWMLEYHYQNQVDPPDWVRESDEGREKWDARGEQWDRALDGPGALHGEPVIIISIWDWQDERVKFRSGWSCRDYLMKTERKAIEG